ncbi:DNA ligase LigA-related protein [Siminovitchia sp. 179-K 8D1 HS]|uniref:DNA ligase LigA-related protein n=1 Tax=Siminovitchia sp. 179-K 8D1 HS TaxID=3142385 RepID=UPI0039A11AA6
MEMVSIQNVKEKIKQRRRQIIVHSYIYYYLNNSVISDHIYDRWCNELVELQEKYPDIASECEFAEEFKGFTGETGFDLYMGSWVHEVAWKILKYHLYLQK